MASLLAERPLMLEGFISRTISAMPEFQTGAERGVLRAASLGVDEVDLWAIQLPLPAALESTLLVTLSEDEQRRASGYVVPSARSQFVASRGVLRQLLQHYLNLPAQAIRFSVGAHGKPLLADPYPLSFNVSHTEGLLMIAVAAGIQVGIDVERIRSIPNASQLAARYFSARERAAMENGPTSFMRGWTCRESALKAFGTGISAGWDAVQIVERSRDQADAVGPGQNCHIRRFTPRPDYVAAVAALCTDFHVRQAQELDFTDLDTDGALNDHLKLC